MQQALHGPLTRAIKRARGDADWDEKLVDWTPPEGWVPGDDDKKKKKIIEPKKPEEEKKTRRTQHPTTATAARGDSLQFRSDTADTD